MLTINDSHRFPYSILGGLKEIEGNYAEASILYGIAVKHSPGNIQGRYQAAEALVNIGLAEQGAAFIENTSFEVMKYRLLDNYELYISQSREIFPRNDNDAAGFLIRAYAESIAENCGEAVKYFKLAGFNDTDKENIYCLQQVGDIEAADALFEKLKKETLPWITAEVKFYPRGKPIDIRTMEIAYLEGDIKRAITELKLAADKNFIVDFELKTLPMYKKLRARPEWSALLTESDKRAAVQREIYFKLIAEEENASL